MQEIVTDQKIGLPMALDVVAARLLNVRGEDNLLGGEQSPPILLLLYIW
jgi:hypothetical protein